MAEMGCAGQGHVEPAAGTKPRLAAHGRHARGALRAALAALGVVGWVACLPERSLSSYAGGNRAETSTSAALPALNDAGPPAPADAAVQPLPSEPSPDAAGLDAAPGDAAPERSLACQPGCECERRDGRDFMFCPSPVTHALALDACAQAGGTLVSAPDAALNSWLSQRMGALAADDFWLSGTDLETEGVWRWQDGRVFFGAPADAGSADFVPWDDQQPNDVNGEDCMRATGGVWRDLDCDDEIAYVCEA